mmetsp:Transcript_10260/g.44598  ORF Transcript_10260/g.44598 Transcript_10260/m.44598 type:complete len:204 (+) Transcript_10260:1433-2044(+)
MALGDGPSAAGSEGSVVGFGVLDAPSRLSSPRLGGVDGSDAASEFRSDSAAASPPSSAALACVSAATRQCAGPDHRDRPMAPATRASDVATAFTPAKDLNRFESASATHATHAFTRDAGDAGEPEESSSSIRRTVAGFESSPPLTTIPASASTKRSAAGSTVHKNASARTRVACSVAARPAGRGNRRLKPRPEPFAYPNPNPE